MTSVNALANLLGDIFCRQTPWPAHTVGQVGQWPYHFFQDPYITTSHPLPYRGGSRGGAPGAGAPPPPPPPPFASSLSSLLTCCRYVATPGLASSARNRAFSLTSHDVIVPLKLLLWQPKFIRQKLEGCRMQL